AAVWELAGRVACGGGPALVVGARGGRAGLWEDEGTPRVPPLAEDTAGGLERIAKPDQVQFRRLAQAEQDGPLARRVAEVVEGDQLHEFAAELVICEQLRDGAFQLLVEGDGFRRHRLPFK